MRVGTSLCYRGSPGRLLAGKMSGSYVANELMEVVVAMAQSEFKFFQLVEDTIRGVTTFVDRYLKTVFYLVFLPHRFSGAHRGSSGERTAFATPFPTTAMSVFLFYLAFVYRLGIELTKEYPSTFGEVTVYHSGYFTVTRFFVYSLPTIIVLNWLARLVSQVSYSRDNAKSDLASMALYASSIPCLLCAICLLLAPSLLRLSAVCGIVVSAVVIWKAIDEHGNAKTLRRIGSAFSYSVLSFGWIITVVVVGFAAELAMSPAASDLLEEHRQKQENKALIDAIQQAIEEKAIEPESGAKLQQLLRDGSSGD